MSIEQTFERIATALEAIAARGAPRDEAYADAAPTTASTTEAPRRRGRPPKAETPAPAPKSFLDDDDTDSSDAPAPLPPPLKLVLDDVRSALIAYQKKHSPEAARKLLKKEGGVDVLSALPEDKFVTVVNACQG